MINNNNTSAAMLFLSANPFTHPLVLDRLIATGCSEAVLVNIASHPRALRGTLSKLAHHESIEVRCAVAENPHVPVAILHQLIQDENPDVRYSVAENHNLPQDLLGLLLDDTNPYVVARAQATIDRLRAVATSAAQSLTGQSSNTKHPPVCSKLRLGYHPIHPNIGWVTNWESCIRQ